MTKEEFEKYWLEGSGMTAEEAKQQGFEVVPCNCGEECCDGWRMEPSGAKLLLRSLIRTAARLEET